MKMLTSTQLRAKMRGLTVRHREHGIYIAEIKRLQGLVAEIEAELAPYAAADPADQAPQRHPNQIRFPWIQGVALDIYAAAGRSLNIAQVAKRIAADRDIAHDVNLTNAVSNVSGRLVRMGRLERVYRGTYRIILAQVSEPEQQVLELQPPAAAKILPPGVLAANIGHDTRVARVQSGN